MKKKRILFSLLYAFMPSLSAILSVLINYLLKADMIILFVVLIYVFTIISIVLFFKFKPCNILFLLSGFLLFSLWVFVQDFIAGGFLQYLATIYVSLFYTAPFVLISIIIFVFIRIFKKDKPC